MDDYFIACDFVSAIEIFIKKNLCGVIDCEGCSSGGALVANLEELANLFRIISEESLGKDYFKTSISSSDSTMCLSIECAIFEREDNELLEKTIKAARKSGFTPSYLRGTLLLKAPIIKLSDEYVYASEITENAQVILNIIKSYYNNI